MSKKVTVFARCYLAFFLGVAALGLTGCDQLRQQVAELVQAKTPQETLSSAQKAFSEGNFSQALEQAEPFAKKPGELQARFALLASQAYARLGKPEEALGQLGKALEGGAVEPTSLITHPDFESLRTDVRFLALLTHSGARSSAGAAAPAARTAPSVAPAQSAGPAPTQAKASDSVSVEIGPSGVSAKAGSVSVKLPP